MILRELSEAVGVSGEEEAVRGVILKAIEGHAADIQIDPMGSITAVKKGRRTQPAAGDAGGAHGRGWVHGDGL
jgi:putative aminopeptidase FrvX